MSVLALASGCGGGGNDGSKASNSSEGPMIACGAEATSKGEGTYYDATGAGACGFPATPNDLMVGAMNAPDFGGSEPCGACAHVVGPEGEVTVRIVDLCPGCKKGDIDLSPQAFEKIAPLGRGRVPISWQYVACNVAGPITYHFKDGSNAFWTAIQLRNTRYAVSKLEFEKDGQLVAVPRVSYNYFVQESGMGKGPLAMRVTDVHGSELDDSGIALGDNVDRPGAAQFPACK